jgi:hypothetical protein
VISVSLHNAVAGVPAATLQGAIVMLPRADPLRRLSRWRSPAWTVLLPGSIIVGTFGLLVLPGLALWVVLLAAVTTPVLALLAVLLVARARWAVLAIAAAGGTLAVLATGTGGRYGMSVMTALACVMVGTALQRLIPGRWLLIGVVAMSVADVVLLATGFGYHQTAVLAAATHTFRGPPMTGARLGAITIGYPDLFLAAALGAFVAGTRDQTRAAGLVMALAIGLDSLLTRGVLLPATVPIALAAVIVAGHSWLRSRTAAPSTSRARDGGHREMTRRTRREMCPTGPPTALVSPVTPRAVTNRPAAIANRATITGQCSER